jgi:hypothetical protein
MPIDIEDTFERWKILHPFLFSLFPILFFFSQNIEQLTYRDMLVPALLALGLSVLALLTCRTAYGNWRKGAIVASIGLFLFFSYGHVWNLISKAIVFGIKTRHDYLLPLWAGVFFAGAYSVYRTDWELKGTTGFLNVASVVVVAMSLVNIGIYGATGQSDEATLGQGRQSIEQTLHPAIDTLPNIYYIVPDGYVSSQTLSRLYDHDNSGFESFLDEEDFHVAGESRANYPQTFLSLASSLNMGHLDTLSAQLGTSKDRTIPYDLIKNSRVLRLLHSAGYHSVSFNSGWGPTNGQMHVNEYLSCGQWWESELYTTLIGTTILSPFRQYFPSTDGRRRTDCIFNTLKNLGDEGSAPLFAFAHIISPHPPLGTGTEGQNPWADKSQFLNRIQYVNGRLKSFIGEVGRANPRPSVIIIQGDHGSVATGEYPNPLGSPSDTLVRERMNVFNAYHLPECEDRLYESISPVNSFRVVLSCYFEEDFDLLSDRSYFSSYDEPYQFEEVTDRARWEAQSGSGHPREKFTQR